MRYVKTNDQGRILSYHSTGVGTVPGDAVQITEEQWSNANINSHTHYKNGTFSKEVIYVQYSESELLATLLSKMDQSEDIIYDQVFGYSPSYSGKLRLARMYERAVKGELDTSRNISVISQYDQFFEKYDDFCDKCHTIFENFSKLIYENKMKLAQELVVNFQLTIHD